MVWWVPSGNEKGAEGRGARFEAHSKFLVHICSLNHTLQKHSMNIIRYAFLLSIFSVTISATAQNRSIDEEKFVSIGGIEQWITISGEDTSKPVILFIHGGPGSTMSQYGNAAFHGWEKEFILVNWDQRGAGRTYGRNAPDELDENFLKANPLTLDRMAKDGIEVAQYLAQYLKKQKVILIGSSWGSILGAEMALRSPDLFHAYIGHAQFVTSAAANHAYEKTHALAKLANDTSSVKTLESLGTPPYDHARTYGQLLRIVKKYERMKATPAPEMWFKVAPGYDNEKDEKNRYDGDDYSFVNFFGDKKFGLKGMASEVDFQAKGFHFRLPVFLVQGELDILTPADVSKSYFEKIKAPRKKYYLLPDAAHGFNQSVVDTFYDVLKNQLALD